MAAVKLGAISVLGIDVDPDATSAAQTNAERNGCADRIEIALAGPETLTGEAFPVAVANLLDPHAPGAGADLRAAPSRPAAPSCSGASSPRMTRR